MLQHEVFLMRYLFESTLVSLRMQSCGEDARVSVRSPHGNFFVGNKMVEYRNFY
jgi:hypothetical protein